MDITSSYIFCIVVLFVSIGVYKLIKSYFPDKPEPKKPKIQLTKEDIERLRKIDAETEYDSTDIDFYDR